ncbi:MAG: hypothetical protein WC787_04595 [Patescibacteria group bacterium]
MSSTNYTVEFDSINSGGDDISSSTNYFIRDTIGEQATGLSSSTNYTVQAGYRQVDETTALTFDIGTQENSTETVFSAFSSGGLSVTVASEASFATDTFIGVVENKGLSQIVALGKITTIGGNVITVDQWDGNPSGISAVPAGGDDFVYRLEGAAAQLGTLSASAGATSLTHTDVTTNAGSGYTVYVSSDGTLRSGSDSIDNVTDGSVTIGSEEYGALVTGTRGTASSTAADFALTTSLFDIQNATSSAPLEQRVGLVYKAAITATTPGGSYSQLVYYTVTANF